MTEHPLVTELRKALGAAVIYERNADPVIVKIDKRLRKPKLWGAKQVGEALGIAHNNLYKLLPPRGDLPEPILDEKESPRGRLWDPDEVRAYVRRKKAAAKAKEKREQTAA